MGLTSRNSSTGGGNGTRSVAPMFPIEDNSGEWLGACSATLAQKGRDKITFITSHSIASFGAWAEQLIAESTGKEGKGIVPIDGGAAGQANGVWQ